MSVRGAVCRFSQLVFSCRLVMGVRFPGAVLSSVTVCRLVEGASRPSVRPSFRPSGRCAFRVFLRLVGRLVERLVLSSCSPCRQHLPCSSSLVEEGPVSSYRGYRAWRFVEVIGPVACFLLYPYTRRFPQLIFSSWRGRGLSRSSLGCGVGILVPMRHRFSHCLASPVGSYRRPVRLLGSSPRLGVTFLHRARCRCQPRRRASRSQGVFSRSPLSARAVFPSSISHWFPITIIVGDVRANRLTGHREHRPFHMGHRGNAIGNAEEA